MVKTKAEILTFSKSAHGRAKFTRRVTSGMLTSRTGWACLCRLGVTSGSDPIEKRRIQIHDRHNMAQTFLGARTHRRLIRLTFREMAKPLDAGENGMVMVDKWSRRARIEDKLATAFSPQVLNVIDEFAQARRAPGPCRRYGSSDRNAFSRPNNFSPVCRQEPYRSASLCPRGACRRNRRWRSCPGSRSARARRSLILRRWRGRDKAIERDVVAFGCDDGGPKSILTMLV